MEVDTIIPCTLVSAPKPHVSKISEKKEKNSKKDHE